MIPWEMNVHVYYLEFWPELANLMGLKLQDSWVSETFAMADLRLLEVH